MYLLQIWEGKRIQGLIIAMVWGQWEGSGDSTLQDDFTDFKPSQSTWFANQSTWGEPLDNQQAKNIGLPHMLSMQGLNQQHQVICY